jgi:hypothetical protein
VKRASKRQFLELSGTEDFWIALKAAAKVIFNDLESATSLLSPPQAYQRA